MNEIETLAHLRSLTDPTPEQLREASDLAWEAIGGRIESEHGMPVYVPPGFPDETPPPYAPHPCASIDDAVRWMVPEGWVVQLNIFNDTAIATIWYCDTPTEQIEEQINTPALALTIAGLAATIEGEK